MLIKSKISFISLSIVVSGVAMFAPAFLALLNDDHETSQIFFYQGLLIALIGAFLGIATQNRGSKPSLKRDMLELTSIFLILPILFAVPLYTLIDSFSVLDSYFEAISSFTTTGATLIQDADQVPASIHLWRASVGWMGGLVMWVTAATIIQHFGFHLFYRSQYAGVSSVDQTESGDLSFEKQPLYRKFSLLLPYYFGLTLILWIALFALGGSGLDSLIFAMSTLSTSGIVGDTAFFDSAAGIWGEMIVVLFLLFGITRLLIFYKWYKPVKKDFYNDSEIRLAFKIVVLVLVGALLYDWQLLVQGYNEDSVLLILENCWGVIFTTISFLTTTGFESTYWFASSAPRVSGFPHLVLLTLVIIGGGVATNSGGVKLLRLKILFENVAREIFHLLYPSGVLHKKNWNLKNIESGWDEAWLIFTMFFVSVVVLLLCLVVVGLDFETALTVSLAAITTTGPLVETTLATSFSFADLDYFSKVMISLGMIVGRLEIVLIMYFLGREAWKR